jgi:hypothetical protein
MLGLLSSWWRILRRGIIEQYPYSLSQRSGLEDACARLEKGKGWGNDNGLRMAREGMVHIERGAV